ncbi:MAG TPA: response regulator transcription factor [Gammaproteobacteria bacterium]|nr:response regulator transcription factor [Gammaproteobacteria bacterium]
MHIALIEDDDAQVRQLSQWLVGAGYRCTAYPDCVSFRTARKAEEFGLILMDWNLPDCSGLDLLRALRSHDSATPLMFATGRDSERDIVQALEAGADDYMIKPLRQHETLGRIKALLRRVTPADLATRLSVPPYQLDARSRKVFRGDTEIELTQREFELAWYIFKNKGQLLSRGDILEKVWGTRPDLNTRTVDTHISKIRRKLDLGPEHGWRLSAVYQYGYRLEELGDA